MNLQPYNQICWVVGNLEEKIMNWVEMGAGPFFILDSSQLPERTYRHRVGRDNFISAHGFFGNTQIELIQPIGDQPSIFHEVLNEKGEVIHHYQPNCRVLDAAAFDAEAKRYTDAGLELVQTLIVPGIGRIVFFDGVERFGFYFELAERPAHIFENSLNMYKAHLNWDGKDPMRQNQFVSLAQNR